MSNTAIVIDPAWNFEVFEREILRYQLDLRAVLLTHSHFDHTDLAKRFESKYQAKVYISRIEQEYYQYECNSLHTLEDKEILRIGGIDVSCYLTPGHTKGSMCYQVENNLFTGDTIFIEGCGYPDKNGGSAEELYDTVQFVKENFSPNTIIYPGHVYGLPVGQYLANLQSYNIYFSIDSLERFVEFRMRKGQKNLMSFL